MAFNVSSSTARAAAPVSPRPCIAAACAALITTGAQAQAGTNPDPAVSALPGVVITSPAQRASVGGFGDALLSETPMQVTVIGSGQLADRNVARLADVVALKASVSDAYNAGGYWDTLSLRGLAIDNRRNYLRDGMSINGETSLPLDNKERIEILEGLSGMQAGLSAPGGLVNLVVKRPTSPVRSALLGWQQSGSVLAALDLGERFGASQAFGLRLNAAQEHLDPQLRASQGQRSLVALAGDWRLGPDTLLEAEVESSRRSQPGQPGFSLLGSTLPGADSIDPRINLNNQPWSQPVVMSGNTASLRVTQRLQGTWRMKGHYVHQALRTDDRLAYPYGCDAEGNYDRYCSNGSFDYYHFHSDGEHRRTDALQVSLEGEAITGPVRHALSLGWLTTRFSLHSNTMPDDGFYPPFGQGTIDGNTVVSLPALPTKPNTTRDEHSNELFVRDHARLGHDWSAWAGLRYTRMAIASVRTDGSEPVSYAQDFVTPWLALSREVMPGQMVYASWGQGIETAVTPNKTGYTNPGQPLPPVRSRQWEVGHKGRFLGDALNWQSAYFQIHQPYVLDNGTDVTLDGQQRRHGLQTELGWNVAAWRLDASAMLLKAEFAGRTDATKNGRRPPNVPDRTLKAAATYRVPMLTGLQLTGAMVHEGNRMVLLDDNSVSIPAWTRLDLGAKYTQRVGATQLTWRAGVDNATDKRAWRESPFQYGHAYLYPLAPRTWRISLQADL